MDRGALDRIVRDIHERWNKPGLALVVVKGSSQVESEQDGGDEGKPESAKDEWNQEIITYGQANKAGRQWDEDTLFSVASTSKHFATLGLGCLIEDGHTLSNGQKLKWNTRVKDVYPTWAPPDETIREQCMRSGMPGHDRGIGDIDNEAILALLPHLKPTANLRQTYQYCNFGINLLAHVIPTLLDGKPFDEYLRERVLSKLGMDDTVPTRDQVLGELSEQYADGWHNELDLPLAYSTWEKVKDDKGTFEPWSKMPQEMFGPKRAYRFLERWKRFGPGAGHVVSTPADMAKWIKGILSASDTSPIPAKVVQAITKPRSASSASGRPGAHEPGFKMYALGLEVFTYRGITAWAHSGDLPGYSTQTIYFPDQKVGVSGMINDDNYGTGLVKAMVYSIADEVLGLGNMADAIPATDKGGWERRFLGEWIDFLGKPKKEFERDIGETTNDGAQEGFADIRGQYQSAGYGTLDFKKIRDVSEALAILPRIRKESTNPLPENEDEIYVTWQDKWVWNWVLVYRIKGRKWRYITLGVFDQVGWRDGRRLDQRLADGTVSGDTQEAAGAQGEEVNNAGRVIWGWFGGIAVFTDGADGKPGVGFFDLNGHGVLDEPVEPTEVNADVVADVWFGKV